VIFIKENAKECNFQEKKLRGLSFFMIDITLYKISMSIFLSMINITLYLTKHEAL